MVSVIGVYVVLLSMTSIDDIRDEGEAIYEFVDDTYNNCGFLNSCMSEFLSDNGVEHEFVTHSGSVVRGSDSHRHEFIVVPAGEVVGEELIVDVAADQFRDELFESGDVGVSFGSSAMLPSVVISGESSEYSSEYPVGVRFYSFYEW